MELIIGLFIMFVLVTIILGILVIIGQRKIKIYESILPSIYDDLMDIIITTNEIDQAGIFESDDEVGIIFKQINSTINKLSKYLIIEDVKE